MLFARPNSIIVPKDITLKASLTIAHILPYLASQYGGPPAVAMKLGAESIKLGCNVSYYATASPSERAELSNLDFDIHLGDLVWPKSWFRSRELAEKFKSNLCGTDILHLHTVWSHPQYISAEYASKKGIPYVITPHGILEAWRMQQKAFKKNIFLKTIGRKILSNAACVHAITPLEIDGIRKAGYRGPIAVIPNGINPDEFSNLPDRHFANER